MLAVHSRNPCPWLMQHWAQGGRRHGEEGSCRYKWHGEFPSKSQWGWDMNQLRLRWWVITGKQGTGSPQKTSQTSLLGGNTQVGYRQQSEVQSPWTSPSCVNEVSKADQHVALGKHSVHVAGFKVGHSREGYGYASVSQTFMSRSSLTALPGT